MRNWISFGRAGYVSEFGGHTAAESHSIAVDAEGDLFFLSLVEVIIWAFQYLLITSTFPINPTQSCGFGCWSSGGTAFVLVSPNNSPQISLDTVGPFLTLRNAGSVDLQISNITVSGGLAKTWGNCGSIIPATTSCILTVSDSLGQTATGSITITSDANPSVQTFAVTLQPAQKLVCL